MTDEERYEAGLEVRRRVIGEEYVQRALDGADDFDREWQRILTEFCWGEVWTSDALDDRQRSLHNICILATLGRDDELEIHLRGALRNGCTPEEISATLIQVAVYAGVPAGVASFRIAKRVLAEEGDGPGSTDRNPA